MQAHGSWRKLKRLTCVPNFDRLVIGARDDLRAIVIEGHGVDALAVGALLARLELESICRRGRVGVRGKRMAVGVAPNGSPASHTLIVPEKAPETILEPSGE